MSVTIRDVAKLAGVSASTVSRVINKSAPISEETTARIYRAMRKPALLFDTRNLLDQAALKALGFRVLAVGKP